MKYTPVFVAPFILTALFAVSAYAQTASIRFLPDSEQHAVQQVGWLKLNESPAGEDYGITGSGTLNSGSATHEATPSQAAAPAKLNIAGYCDCSARLHAAPVCCGTPSGHYASCCSAPSCGCDAQAPSCGCDASCGCEASCGCDSCGCADACGCAGPSCMDKLHQMKHNLHCKMAGLKCKMQGMKCQAKSKFSSILAKLRDACSSMGSHSCGCADSCGCAAAPCCCTDSGVYQGEVHARSDYPAAAPSPHSSGSVTTPVPAATMDQDYGSEYGMETQHDGAPAYTVPSSSAGSPTVAPRATDDGMFRVEGMTDLDAMADPATPPNSIDPMTEEGRRRQREFGNGENLPRTPEVEDMPTPKVNESGASRFFRWFGMK